MKSTYDIPGPLLEQALELSGEKTKTRVLVVALEEYVRRLKVERLFARAGRGEIRLDAGAADRARHAR